MKRGKNIINILYYLFKWLLNLNIVLGAGMVGFQILNIIRPQKDILLSYLGKFNMKVGVVGKVNDTNLFIDNFIGSPEIALDSNLHPWFVLLFSLVIVSITIIYNYLIVRIFYSLNESVKEGSPFTLSIATHLTQLSYTSLIVFIISSILSILKLYLLSDILIGNMIVKPIFDNGILNFLWIGIFFYLIKEIYKVGLHLKKEQDLTI